MSISEQIVRIQNNIAAAYTAAESMGATMPPTQNSANLATTIGSVSACEHLTWHQCPQAVRDYLAYVAAHPYSAGDCSYTYIDDFAPDPAIQSNTKPIGKTVDGVTYYDNEPNTAVPFASANKAGTLTALDKVRWYNTTYREKNTGGNTGEIYDAGMNCRDLGGWACDGGTVRYGMLVRSGELNAADKALMVDKVGVKTEVNLLPSDYQARKYSPWGIDWVGNPTTVDYMYNTGDAYKDQWQLYLGTIIRSVIRGKPVIFHCGAGADKTGTMAVMLLGILGCSRQDIDIDYELTCFAFVASGQEDPWWRCRKYAGYTAYLGRINSVPLIGGLSDSFRNRCISFALSVGITIDEINAFRAACINGTPETITVSMNTCSISKALSNVTCTNTASGVTQYQPYETELIVPSGYYISALSITMGGVSANAYYSNGRISIPIVTGDLAIAATAIAASASAPTHTVVKHLSHCSCTGETSPAYCGSSYSAVIAADSGYTLEGATVVVQMGGEAVSGCYSNGTITIPTVTGNIDITVTAVENTASNLFNPASSGNYTPKYRFSGTGEIKTSPTVNNGVVTHLIPCTAGQVIHVVTDTAPGAGDISQGYVYVVAFYDASEVQVDRKSTTQIGTRSADEKEWTFTAPSGTYTQMRISIPYTDLKNIVITAQ